jgi:activator of HSP90 ATPase
MNDWASKQRLIFRTEKNCFKWAKGYFKEKFTQIEVSDKAGNTARISEVIECTGDVDLNQRKGKIITLFDLAFRLRFKGKTASGTDVKGIISIPEVMHDTEPDEYVFEISVDNQTKEMEPVKQLVREEMTKELRKCLGKFTADLIAAHSKDVYIPPEQLGTQAPTPAAAGVIPGANKAKNATSVTSQTSSTNSTYFSTTDIKVNTEFMASAADIYSALLDKAKVQLWTGGPAEIRPEVGSDFRLFNGNITGTIVELVENEKIVMSWRSASWPASE